MEKSIDSPSAVRENSPTYVDGVNAVSLSAITGIVLPAANAALIITANFLFTPRPPKIKNLITLVI